MHNRKSSTPTLNLRRNLVPSGPFTASAIAAKISAALLMLTAAPSLSIITNRAGAWVVGAVCGCGGCGSKFCGGSPAFLQLSVDPHRSSISDILPINSGHSGHIDRGRRDREALLPVVDHHRTILQIVLAARSLAPKCQNNSEPKMRPCISLAIFAILTASANAFPSPLSSSRAMPNNDVGVQGRRQLTSKEIGAAEGLWTSRWCRRIGGCCLVVD